FLHHERGIVDNVSLMPHPGLLKLQDAITLLELILKQWDAQLDERAVKNVAKWKAAGDVKPYMLAEYEGGADLRGENKAAVYFSIRSTFEETGWFLAIDVTATLEEERKLWGS